MKDDPFRQLSDFVGQIYDAALDPARWPAFTESLGNTLRGNCIVFSQDCGNADASCFAFAGFEPGSIRSYEKHYGGVNPFARKWPTMPLGVALINDDFFNESELARTEFYNDWMKPQALYFGIGSVAERSATVVTNFSVMRPKAAGDFSMTERELFRLLVPHLQRGFQMHRQLVATRLQRDAGLDGLDRLGTALLLTDATGRLLFANRMATALLERADGLLAVGGCIAGLMPAQTEALRRLIAAASHTLGSGGVVSLPRRNGHPLTALVSPIRGRDLSLGGGAVSAAAVFVRDPERRARPATVVLRQLFGLTLAEARIAAALVDGKTIETIAEEFAISRNTARTHLRNLMGKTETRRQSDLVAAILRSVAGLESAEDRLP